MWPMSAFLLPELFSSSPKLLASLASKLPSKFASQLPSKVSNLTANLINNQFSYVSLTLSLLSEHIKERLNSFRPLVSRFYYTAGKRDRRLYLTGWAHKGREGRSLPHISIYWVISRADGANNNKLAKLGSEIWNYQWLTHWLTDRGRC